MHSQINICFYRTIYLYKQFFSSLFRGVVCIFLCVSCRCCCYLLNVFCVVNGEHNNEKKVDTNMQMSIFTRYEFSELISLNGFQAFGLNF